MTLIFQLINIQTSKYHDCIIFFKVVQLSFDKFGQLLGGSVSIVFKDIENEQFVAR